MDLDWQPARPVEARAACGANTEEDAEPRTGVERAVAQDSEVACLSPKFKRTDLYLGTDRDKLDQWIGTGCACVEPEANRSDRHEVIDGHKQGVDFEDEALEAAIVIELDLDAQRFVVDAAVRTNVLRRIAVRQPDCQAVVLWEQLSAAGSNIDRTGEGKRLTEGDVEVSNAEADVVECQNAAELDVSGSNRVAVGISVLHGRTGVDAFATKAEFSVTDREAVAPDD